MFLKIWEKHDKTKVLFATDSPWSDPARIIAKVHDLPITQAEKSAIFADNAKKLLASVYDF